jgi:hypothetical protein
MIQSGWGDLNEPPRQLGNRRVRCAKKRRMRKSPELVDHRRIDFRNSMPKKVAPKRRSTVEQAPAAIIDEVVAFGAHDDQGLGRKVFAHLRKRMPHVLGIPTPNIFRTW